MKKTTITWCQEHVMRYSECSCAKPVGGNTNCVNCNAPPGGFHVVGCPQIDSEGRKYDSEKLRWDLLPMAPIQEVIRVLTHGAIKYGDYNWQKVEPHRERYYAAAMRHITAWWDGEICDKDTKFHHLAHAVCCLIFLIWFDMRKEKE